MILCDILAVAACKEPVRKVLFYLYNSYRQSMKEQHPPQAERGENAEGLANALVKKLESGEPLSDAIRQKLVSLLSTSRESVQIKSAPGAIGIEERSKSTPISAPIEKEKSPEILAREVAARWNANAPEWLANRARDPYAENSGPSSFMESVAKVLGADLKSATHLDDTSFQLKYENLVWVLPYPEALLQGGVIGRFYSVARGKGSCVRSVEKAAHILPNSNLQNALYLRDYTEKSILRGILVLEN